MANVAEQFINKFHSIEGVTIAERKKNFFTLLRQSNHYFEENTSEVDQIVSNLQPKTFLEELFKIDFLIHFRKSEELYQILKDGNDIFVSKIIKQVWFITDFFGKFEPVELVNNVLPLMSYSVRIKLLGKLSRFLNSEQFELIYDAVEKQYGLFVASKFIYGCSLKKIRETIVNHSIRINPKKLILLYYKESALIDFYLTNVQFSSNKLKILLKFLLNADFELYKTITKKHNLSIINFGKHISRKIVKSRKQEIIQNPNEFRHLKTKVILRKIGVESTTLFCNALPPIIEEIDKIQWFLNCLSKKYHYKYYIEIVQNHYGTTFLEYPKLITDNMMKFIKNNNERSNFAAVKVNNGDENFIKYLQPDLAIPILKGKITSTANDFDKSKYIEDLIKTCHINNDKNALIIQVLKYFLSSYHNKLNIYATVVQHLEKYFSLNTFTEEMWQLLDDLLLNEKKIIHYKNLPNILPLATYNILVSAEQKLNYFDFLLGKNLGIDVLIEVYFQTYPQIPTWGTYSKCLEKKILFYAINNFNLESLEADIKYKCSLIHYLNLWNLHYKEDQLSVYDFPLLLKAFNVALKETIYLNNAIKDFFRSKIFTLIENPFRNQYLVIYWKSFNAFGRYKDLKWFLKYDPNSIVKYICEFLKNVLAKKLHVELQLWQLVKKYGHLQIDKIVKKHYYEKITDENSIEEKPKFLVCLSVLMKPEEYAAFADSFKPANKTLNLEDEKEVRVYSLQCAIATHFKYVRSSTILESLLNYCVGDYLKYSLKSLYSILYRTPERLLTKHLKYLSKQAVSVRKHALYLTCQLSTVEKVEIILKLLHEKETTPSLRKKLFETSIKYFSKNPSDDFFEIVKLNMLFVNKNDSETLESMTSSFPEKYKLSYIEYTLDYMEKTIDVENKLDSYKCTLLESIKPKMCSALSLAFGLKLIENNLKANMDRVIYKTFSFVSSQFEKELIMTRIFNILEECNHSQNLKFFENWYENIMTNAENMPHFKLFFTYYSNKIQQSTDFKYFLKLEFLKMKVLEDISPKTDFATFSEKAFDLLNHLISVYGLHITWFYGLEFISVVKMFYKNEEHWEFLYNFFSKYPISYIAAMILNVIYVSNYVSPPVATILNKLIHKMQKMRDPIVQITLNCTLEDYLNSNYFIAEANE